VDASDKRGHDGSIPSAVVLCASLRGVRNGTMASNSILRSFWSGSRSSLVMWSRRSARPTGSWPRCSGISSRR